VSPIILPVVSLIWPFIFATVMVLASFVVDGDARHRSLLCLTIPYFPRLPLHVFIDFSIA